MKRKPITQKDIADKLGISQKAVSLAFQSPDALSKATVAEIIEAAKVMGYRPNRSAQAIRRGRFNNVAVLGPASSWKASLPAQVLDGILDHLTTQGISLSLARISDQELGNTEKLPEALIQHGVDGVILDYDVDPPPHVAQFFSQFRVPCIWYNTDNAYDCIVPDDHAAAFDAVEYLVRLGHQRIGYLDANYLRLRPALRHCSRTNRLAGYRQSMKQANLECSEILDVVGHEPGLQQLGEHITGKKLTALLCYGGGEAILALRVAEVRLGMRVPMDLSLMAIDGRGFADIGIKLSIVRIPEFEIGQRAAELLLQKIAAPEQLIPSERIHCSLISGSSSGVPRD